MSDRILKSEQTREGGEYQVTVREPLPTPVTEQQPLDVMDFGASVQSPAKDTANKPLHGKDETDYMLPSDRARSEAERIVADAEQMASEIAAQANAKAITIKEQVEDEVTSLRDLAISEIKSEREMLETKLRNELEAEYRERYQKAISALERAAHELEQKQGQYLTDIKQPALKLMLAIAQQLLGRELSQHPETIAAMIARACELLKPEHVATVSVCPDSFAVLAESDTLNSALRDAGIIPERVDVVCNEALASGRFAVHIGGMSVEYNLDEVIAQAIAHVETRAESHIAAGE